MNNGISAGVEMIGPKEAEQMLGFNTHNRSISLNTIKTMARDMVEKKWQLNGETIKLSSDNLLLDGQHRLLAVIEAGIKVPMMIVRGLESETQQSVDTGRKRTFANVLNLDGEGNVNNLAASVRFTWFLQAHGKPKAFGITPSVAELRAYLAANPGIRESLPIGRRASVSSLRYVPSVGVALHYLMANISDTGADDFWEHLIEGDFPDSPIHVLRETLLRDLSAPHRMAVDYRAALTIKAWNAMRDGRSISNIGWRASGKAAEPFPSLK